MQTEFIITEPMVSVPMGNSTGILTDYSEILRDHGLSYRLVGYHLLVGEPVRSRGWILHISVIISQMTAMLQKLVPRLVAEGVAFKIPKDKDTAKNLLDGYLGYNQVGKMMSIYPPTDAQAEQLAISLIEWTKEFRGPAIPTDACIGNTVYTRFGAFKPILGMDASGKMERFVQDEYGNVVPDPYFIPFQVPAGAVWPFHSMTPSVIRPDKRILNGIYKSHSILKADARGNVWKGIYLKSLFRVHPCVIKHGRMNTCADDEGRDIRERLLWQQKLHNALYDFVPIPKIFDLLELDGDAYLVMEFIKGVSLHELVGMINKNCKSWIELNQKEQLMILDYLLRLISVIQSLHERGYVHRDITPVNFLVDQQKRMVMIDVELAYSLNAQEPLPPYGFGTPGFLSPEQAVAATPTIKEDIYGISASMVSILTGLSPVKFGSMKKGLLYENLLFFIRDEKLAELIAHGLHTEPEKRPDLSSIKLAVEAYRDRLKTMPLASLKDGLVQSDPDRLEELICSAIRSLVQPPMMMAEGLWVSESLQKETLVENPQKAYDHYAGLQEGIGGILYFLAKAQQAGYDTGACGEMYKRGWEFIQGGFLSQLPNLPPGLYKGAAGIAAALAAGIQAGLLDDREEIRSLIQQCLVLPPISPDMATGVAGQGIAVLQCEAYLSERVTERLLNTFVRLLLDSQQKDGSWLVADQGLHKGKRSIHFGYGVSGIVWFLLETISRNPDQGVKKAVVKSLGWLSKQTGDLKGLFDKKVITAIGKKDPYGQEGSNGIILSFIKAYEILQDPSYQKMAEDALSLYPYGILFNNFTQDGGLAELGELYLEAARVFRKEEWQHRANWLAQVLQHTSIQRPGSICYWLQKDTMIPTADFLAGNSGIIHFLMRYLHPDKFSYRLLV